MNIDGSLAPRTLVRVLYDSTDITRDITPYVEGLTFTDTLEEADDLDITLADPDGLWSGPWMPDMNARLSVDIISQVGDKQSKLPCGTFFIDTVTESGPSGGVTLKATSADLSTTLRREVKTHAWEHVSLKTICQDIASKGGLSLQYLTAANPTYQRIEQRLQSDLGFVEKLCNKESLRVKVAGSALVIFDFDTYNDLPAVATYSKPKKSYMPGTPKHLMHEALDINSPVLSWTLERQVHQAYSACLVRYRNPVAKKLLQYLYKPEDAPKAGATLIVNERCEDLAHAQRIGKAKLEMANRMANKAGITLIGDTQLAVGCNIALDSTWANYAGKYAIEEATHSMWAYTTELKLRLIG